MTKRTLTAALAALLIVSLAAPASAGFWNKGDQIEGSGKMESRTFDFDEITAYQLDGSLDTEIAFGDRQKVEVTLDDNLFDNLEIEVDHGTLIIGWDESCDPDRKAKVVLTLSKLDEIDLNGAGDIVIDGFSGKSFDLELRGAGDVTIDGKCDELEITLMGVGDIEARKLDAKHVDVTVTGVGDAEVTAVESIEARVSGVGDIKYWGNPESENTKVSGIGDIKRK